MKYEVRCCCDPTKILGSLEMPERPTGKFRIAIRQSGSFQRDDLTVETVELEVAEVAFAIVDDPYSEARIERWKAIKDNHAPIEALRKIPGFVEA